MLSKQCQIVPRYLTPSAGDRRRGWLRSSQLSDKELHIAFAMSGSFEPASPEKPFSPAKSAKSTAWIAPTLCPMAASFALSVLPKQREFLKSVGLVSFKINSLEASKLDSKYVLVKAVWQMRFQRGASEPVDSQNSTTYVLSAVGDSLRIVLQVDDQDLMKKVRDLGLES
jgi:hypothetical protein